MLVDEELLDETGQLEALQSIKGQSFAHGPKAEREGTLDILLMQPRTLDVDGEAVITWSMGHRPGTRRKIEYDSDTDEISSSIERDNHTITTRFIALPRLGVVAVDDRLSAEYMGAQAAISRLRSAFQHVDGGAFQAQLLAPGDVDSVLGELSLTEYSYTVRRYNPHPPSDLARRTSEAMAAEGIGTQRGVVRPMPGEKMHAGDGLIQGTSDLAEAGYGVRGFRGRTAAGNEAQVAKPSFDMDRTKNLKAQGKQQRLRVFFERPANDFDVTPSVVAELVRFYEREPADVLEKPAGGVADQSG
jgi:hypothetical protein